MADPDPAQGWFQIANLGISAIAGVATSVVANQKSAIWVRVVVATGVGVAICYGLGYAARAGHEVAAQFTVVAFLAVGFAYFLGRRSAVTSSDLPSLDSLRQRTHTTVAELKSEADSVGTMSVEIAEQVRAVRVELDGTRQVVAELTAKLRAAEAENKRTHDDFVESVNARNVLEEEKAQVSLRCDSLDRELTRFREAQSGGQARLVAALHKKLDYVRDWLDGELEDLPPDAIPNFREWTREVLDEIGKIVAPQGAALFREKFDAIRAATSDFEFKETGRFNRALAELPGLVKGVRDDWYLPDDA